MNITGKIAKRPSMRQLRRYLKLIGKNNNFKGKYISYILFNR